MRVKYRPVAEPLEKYEFSEALKKALSPGGYHFRISSGDEFVLLARKYSYKAGSCMHEEVKLDLFHSEGGKLTPAARADRTNVFHDDGRKCAEACTSLPWDISDRSPEHLKEAEKMRMVFDEATIVFDPYSSRAGGRFKGIGSFLRSFHDLYSKSRDVESVTSFSLTGQGEDFLKAYCKQSGAKSDMLVGERMLTISLSNADIPKPCIERVKPS